VWWGGHIQGSNSSAPVISLEKDSGIVDILTSSRDRQWWARSCISYMQVR
jgi:hypothetical protein